MAVFEKLRPEVPSDLAKYEPRKWFDIACGGVAKGREVFRDRFDPEGSVIFEIRCHVSAPSLFRSFLRAKLGEIDGDDIFYDVLDVPELAHRYALKVGRI